KKDTKPFFEEHWTRPAGGVMIGMGRELGDRNALSFYEYLRIEAKPDGLYYVAQPFGKSSTAFKLISNNKSGALFENPAHDFPQKIHYLRRGPAELTVRLSAADKTKKPTEFVLYRDATPVDH
ncbi:MAG: hypothetical protein K2Z81_27120, partial [Cyanobacteria bacterium]|nr:hypothetical protein [Cyanobacteriota bacterium]